MLRVIALAGLLLASGYSVANTINVLGLFENKAVIIVDGKRHVLDVGEETPEGIRLIRANSQNAVLLINGKEKTFALGDTEDYRVKKVTEETVIIRPAVNGMYHIDGEINGQRASFVVDTGASHIAMNNRTAERLKIDYKRAKKVGKVETASGIELAYLVHLKTVKVGNIIVYNVPALVLVGRQPSHILLGMSFLKNLEMQNKNKLLYLRQKF
ncbi:MAG: TIGR02281 family clan AA aspartic protease [Legionellales bacterium]|nr:TIGR02281 family clan AA aspartic protease [Legionellales bacterium]|tara:strand:- start:1329 stop:1967 length:639 start_codon:yes stop_codon:yes gene_type:complete